MAGGSKNKKRNTTSKTLDSSEDERLMPKKTTPGVNNPTSTMHIDEEEQTRGRSFSNISDSDGDANKQPEDKKTLQDPPGFEQPDFHKMHSTIAKHSQERSLLKKIASFKHPFEGEIQLTTYYTTEPDIIPPTEEEGKPNRILATIETNSVWIQCANSSIDHTARHFHTAFTDAGEEPPIEGLVFNNVPAQNKVYLTAEYHEDASYAAASFMYFVVSRVAKRYAHDMRVMGFVFVPTNMYGRNKWTPPETVLVTPLQLTQLNTPDDKRREERDEDTAYDRNVSSKTTTSEREEEATAHDRNVSSKTMTTPSGEDTGTTPEGAATPAVDVTANKEDGGSTTTTSTKSPNTTCNKQLQNAEDLVRANEKTWADRTRVAEEQEEADVVEMTDQQAEEEPFHTQKTCLCDIGRINQRIDYDRLLKDLAVQFPGQFRYFVGYEHRNRRRTLGLTFSDKRAVESVALKGLNTHGLHLQFTLEIPGLVMVSLDNIPTEVPMQDVVKVMSKYGTIHGEPYISKKTYAGRSITIGTRVVGLIMHKHNPVPPTLRIRGFEATAKYSGMEEVTFRNDHRRTPRRTPTRSRSGSRATRDNTREVLDKAAEAVRNAAITMPPPSAIPKNAYSQPHFTMVPTRRRQCFGCGQDDHIQKDCPHPTRGPHGGRGGHGGRNRHLFGRQAKNATEEERVRQETYNYECEKHTATKKDGSIIKSFLHPDYDAREDGTMQELKTNLLRIKERFMRSQEDRTFDTREHTDPHTPPSSPRDGPPGAAIKDGKRCQVVSHPLNVYTAFGLLETGTLFQVHLAKEDKDLIQALSGYVQFGPLRDIDASSLDPTVYSVSVQEMWGKMNFGEDVDVEAEVHGIATPAFDGVQIDLTHIENEPSLY